MCETLLPDVVASEAHQNDCSYVCELSRPTLDSLRKNLHGGRLHTEDLKKLQNWGVGACVGMGALPGTIR